MSDVWHKGFEGTDAFEIRPSIGVDDPVIRHVGALGLHELRKGGPGGRLYVEGLAAMLSVHLLRNYGTPERLPLRHKGGLAPLQMRRVIEYIDAHMADELGVVELAAIADLSPHHFGEAFKISVGTSPHRFVIERRVRHALHLLHNKDRSIAEVARAVGFSSQSHFTTNLRRLTGMTPGRFLRSLR
jgi:AraC family transcriptional regulator